MQHGPDPTGPGRIVRLDPSDFKLRGGEAFTVRSLLDTLLLRSDANGISRIRMLEDGAALSPHEAHAEIESKSKGRFSHWGFEIVFSSTDGSDPRTNGRRYELVLPPHAAWWHRVLQAVGMLAAVAAFYRFAFIFFRRRHLPAAGSIVLLLGAHLGFTLLAADLSSDLTFFEAVDQSLKGAEKQQAAPAVKDGDPHRTVHLVGGAIPAPPFTPATHRAKAPAQRDLAFLPFGGVQEKDGFVELRPESGLENPDPLSINRVDLEILVLNLEVLEGEHLNIRFSEKPGRDGGSRGGTVIAFSVRPKTGIQTIRFERPVLEGACSKVNFIAVEASPESERPPIVRVHSAFYRRRLDALRSADAGARPVALEGCLRTAIWQSVPGSFTLPLSDVKGDRLHLAVGALSEAIPAAVDFRVLLRDRAGAETLLLSGKTGAGAPWRDFSVVLPPRGAEQKLVLTGGDVPEGAVLIWSGVRVSDTSRPAKRFVVVLVDTLRADALGCYGKSGDPTPNLDRLAGEGLRFDEAYSQTYWTRPSLVSIMTGHYIRAAGVLALDQKLPESYTTLAERFSEAGFTTVSIITNGNAGPHAGLGQGFSRIRLLGSITGAQGHYTSKLVDEVVLPEIDDLGEDDLFLFLHLMEVHGPYGPMIPPDPNPWLDSNEPVLPYNPALDWPWNPNPTTSQRIALYHHDVKSTDKALGGLFSHIDRVWGKDTVIAVVADHGEWLGEHGLWGHSINDLHPENVQVPLIIRARDRIEPGSIQRGPVEIRCLSPTLLELAGLKNPVLGTADSLLHAPSGDSKPCYALSDGGGENYAYQVFSLFGPGCRYVSRIPRWWPCVDMYRDGRRSQTFAPWPVWMRDQAWLRMHDTYLYEQKQYHDRLWQGDSGDRVIDPQTLERLRGLGYGSD